MIRQSVCCCIAAAGCGRIGFDPMDSELTGLVVRYPMDVDPSTGAIAATVPGYEGTCAPCPVATAGKLAGAYSFTGNAQVRLPDITTNLVGAAYSIVFWARPRGAQIFDSTMISKPFAPAATDNVELLSIEAGKGRLKFESTMVGGTTNYDVLFGPNQDLRNPPGWHHIVASWDGSDKRIYIDGVLVGTEATTIAESSEPLLVGFDLDANTPLHFYDGDLDDLQFYSRALTASEVAALTGP